jgi:hypothetical protein
LIMRSGGRVPGTRFCSSPPQQCGGTSWYAILDSDGQPLTTELGCGVVDCAACETGGAGCPAFCGFSQLLDAELTATWSGVLYGSSGQCESGYSCRSRSCAKPGKYVAHFCGYALTSTDGSADCEKNAATTSTCVDMPFEYPVAGPVVAVLDPQK